MSVLPWPEMEEEYQEEDRRSGHGRRVSDQEPASDRRLLFDAIKWGVSILVAVIGIYVISERRAAVTDVSATYLDRKADEIKQQMKEQSAQINVRLDSLQQSIQDVTAAYSGMQQQIKSQDDKINDIKGEIQTLREHDSMQERMLSELKARK